MVAVIYLHANQLPSHWYGYDGVDALVFTGGDEGFQLQPAQRDAIVDWVKVGGRLVLCAGSRAAALGPLAELIPGRVAGVKPLRSLGALSQYAGTSQAIDLADDDDQAVAMTMLTDVTGVVEVYDPESRRETGALVVRQPLGFGQVVFIGLDLDQPPFVAWPEQGRLVSRLLRDGKGTRGNRAIGHSDKVVHVGYTDLSGQLRSALDQFNGVTRVEFAWVAGLLVVFVALVGPADYFILRRLGRMHWTWLTFPFVVVLFCLIALLLVEKLRGSQVRVNQLDIVDVDLASSVVRGSTWASVYSPATRAVQITAAADGADSLLAWNGLPGTGLGGLDARVPASLFSDPYDIEKSPDGDRYCVSRAPVLAAGSKGFARRWKASLDDARAGDASQLKVTSDGVLKGTLQNPLAVPLQDVMLVFNNLVMRIDGELAPGDEVAVDSLRLLNLQWRLTRRTVVTKKRDAEDINQPWKPGELNVPRIVEMLMFHEAAGGSTYTEMEHRYRASLDLTGHLELGRAMLVGRAQDASCDLQIDDRPASEYEGSRWTYYRIVLPVADMPVSERNRF